MSPTPAPAAGPGAVGVLAPGAPESPAATRPAPDADRPPRRRTGPPRPQRRRARRADGGSTRARRLRLAASVVAGLVLCASFPPVGWWPLAPVAVAALTLLVRGRRPRTAYALGVAYGLGFFLPLITWSKVAGLDGWLLLSLAQAMILGLLGPALALVQRVPGWPAWTAGLWVAQEALRDRAPFGGFPWGRLAFSQAHTPYTPLAALGGAPLVTAAVALSGGLLARAAWSAWSVGRPATVPSTLGRDRGRAGTVGALAVLGALATGAVGLAVPLHTGAQGSTVVAAVQGNVPRTGLAALGQKRAVTRNHAAATERLAADVRAGRVPAPDVVLWPENSSDLDPFQDAQAAALLSQASRAIGRPILVGAVLVGPGAGHVRNAGLVWGPDGYEGQMYVKRHPVPFAEYLPGRPVLQKIVHRFQTLMPNDFVAGRTPGHVELAGVRVSDVICFEVAYDGLVRQAVAGGGQLLVVQTNNATFGRRGETQQQLAMAQLRAVEHDRSTVVVATSGVSALVGPDGTILRQSVPFTQAELVARVPLRSSRTVADRLGELPEWLLVAFGLVPLLLAVAIRRRRSEQVRQA